MVIWLLISVSIFYFVYRNDYLAIMSFCISYILLSCVKQKLLISFFIMWLFHCLTGSIESFVSLEEVYDAVKDTRDKNNESTKNIYDKLNKVVEVQERLIKELNG